MKPEQFIREFGVEKAREVVEGAHDGANHFVGSTYLKLIGEVWWSAWLPEWSHKDNCMVNKWKGESIELMKTWGEVFKLDELKLLVESVDLVNKHGGIYNIKFNVLLLKNGLPERLKQAIADYEWIYGEGNA